MKKKLNLLKETNTSGPSWYDDMDPQNKAESASNQKISKITGDSDNDDEDNYLDENLIESNCWIMEIDLLMESMKKIAVCKSCHGELSLHKNKNHRAGLATKFEFRC